MRVLKDLILKGLGEGLILKGLGCASEVGEARWTRRVREEGGRGGPGSWGVPRLRHSAAGADYKTQTQPKEGGF